MTNFETIFWTFYVLGTIYNGIKWTRICAWDNKGRYASKPDGDDWMLGLLAGGGIGIFWPAWVLGRRAWWVFINVSAKFNGIDNRAFNALFPKEFPQIETIAEARARKAKNKERQVAELRARKAELSER